MASTTPLLVVAFDEGWSILIKISPILILAVVILCLLVLLIKWISGNWRGKIFEIDKTELGLGSGKITFKPNLKDQQIAYAIWVELSTRKIGLPIDLEHDVIDEIYNSWYNFFSVTRELIKDIPANKIQNKSTRQIVNLSIDVLNLGLRPHLTKWQARFRHWYQNELDKKEGDIDPQSIQARYPKYDELRDDLLRINEQLIKYRDKMSQLIQGTSKID